MDSESIRKEPTLFELLDDLSFKKKYLYDEMLCKSYNMFMLNRGMAQHIDTVMLANELNKHSILSPLMHHDYLFYGVDAKKRYGKWAKSDLSEQQSKLISFIKNKYNVNNDVATFYLKIHDVTELENEYRKSLETGGKTK